MRPAIYAAAFAALALLAAGPAAAADELPDAKEKYVGYYYPEPAQTEVYEQRVQTLSKANKSMRVGFVTGIAKAFHERPYPQRYVIYEKSADSDVMIVAAMSDGVLDTIYRARAVLADLTHRARQSPVFQEIKEGREHLTFLDMCKLLGFRELVVTDGRDFAHRFLLK